MQGIVVANIQMAANIIYTGCLHFGKSKAVPCHGCAHIILHFVLSSLAVTLLCPRHVAPRCAKPHDKALRHAPAELFTGARDFQSDCGVRGVLN